MNYSIAIYGGPTSHQAAHSALNFAKAAIGRGHIIQRVFFYHDGVYNASALISPPQDETDAAALWRDLSRTHDIEIIACIAAAVRRGVLDEKEAGRYKKSSHNLADDVTLSGLGQLIDAGMGSDRLITFGV